MNVFFLDRDPQRCAADHCDKHVVKMILEYAQLMSTTHQLIRANPELYKPTHVNHPCAVWLRSSAVHYRWLYAMWLALLEEYTIRYGRVHASARLVEPLKVLPELPDLGWRDPPQAMPEMYRQKDPVQAYRAYYVGEKISFAKWKSRPQPTWLNL